MTTPSPMIRMAHAPEVTIAIADALGYPPYWDDDPQLHQRAAYQTGLILECLHRRGMGIVVVETSES